MRYHVPFYLWIDAPSPEHAAAAKQAVERLLTQDPMTSSVVQSMVAGQLQAIGVQNLGISVGDPKASPATPSKRTA